MCFEPPRLFAFLPAVMAHIQPPPHCRSFLLWPQPFNRFAVDYHGSASRYDLEWSAVRSAALQQAPTWLPQTFDWVLPFRSAFIPLTTGNCPFNELHRKTLACLEDGVALCRSSLESTPGGALRYCWNNEK